MVYVCLSFTHVLVYECLFIIHTTSVLVYVCLFIIHTCVGVCLSVYHSHMCWCMYVCLSFTPHKYWCMYVCLSIIHTTYVLVYVCMYVYHSHHICVGVCLSVYHSHRYWYCLSFTRSPMLVMAAPNIIQYPSQGPIVSPIEREVVGGTFRGEGGLRGG